MELISAKIKVLNDLMDDLYTDMYSTENTDTHDILRKVCLKIQMTLNSLHDDRNKLIDAERVIILNEMLVLLKELDASDLPDDYDAFIQNDKISNLACDVLIDSNGRCIWDNHKILSTAGFSVFPGEKDRFGWLTGCIQTKKGIIVYG